MPKSSVPSSRSRSRSSAGVPAWTGGVAHLLVVGPDPKLLNRLAAELPSEAYTVHAVESGPQAVRRARYIYYPVILMALPPGQGDGTLSALLVALHEASLESEIVVLAGAGFLAQPVDTRVLGVVSYLGEPSSAEHLRLTVAQAVERQRLRRRLTALSEVAYAVGQLMDLPRVLEVGLDKTLEVIGRGVGVLYLLDDDTGELELRIGRGLAPGFLEAAQRLPLAGDVHEQALAQMQPVYLEDLRQARGSSFARLLQAEGARSAAVVPLRMRDQALGTLTVASRTLRAFSADDLRVLVSIGQHLGVALAHGRLHERERMAREQLTDLLLALQQQAEELRNLSGRVVRAQEAERQHIARELHDGIGQVLTALRIDLGLVADMLPSDPGLAAQRLDEARDHMGQLMNDVRRMSAELRPSMLDDLGLVPTLNWLADGFARRLSIPVTFTARDWPEHVHPDVEIGIFRLVQEALNNAVKHAGATQLAVELTAEDDRALLDVMDNGQGFDVQEVLRAPASRQGSGLRGMRERVVQLGGDIVIDTQPGQGTHVHVSLPLVPPDSREERGATAPEGQG